MYPAKKNNRVKRCKIIELQPKLISKHSILTMVFQAPNRTDTVLLGAEVGHFKVFFHGVTSKIEVSWLKGKTQFY